ncbi:hypothetical protein SAMN05216226_111104 [Halovenus aranensis]|jgi:hypothetical protein|uniref:Uncharacterized protein n=1 Tax=Halovenus aranensis TaxID=890420 RepID=A0A1G8XIT8_9EURY|nr:hypothetical protein [Halovenus aranensis]SDJ90461.1 hypothetical protein SAMN05216226_111104 [Halovenus aranensis]
MADDHDDRPAYDPSEPTPPEREPPYRQTAPQSAFTGTQVTIGCLVSVVGLAVIFGLPLVLA